MLIRSIALLSALTFAASAKSISAQQTTGSQSKSLSAHDIPDWKSIRSAQLSHDGRWFGYVLAPNEGNGEVILKSVGNDGKELRFPAGDVSSNPALQISSDGQWAAFISWPMAVEADKLRKDRRPIQGKGMIVNLTDGKSRSFEKVRSISFAGKKPSWVAFHTNAAEASTPSARTRGSDLILLKLQSDTVFNVGNISEFAFDDSGRWLATIVDAASGSGNGVHLRDMNSASTSVLDTELRSTYSRLAWSDTLPAIAFLRSTIDSAGKDTVISVGGIHNIGSNRQKSVVASSASISAWPEGMEVSTDRTPRWTYDQKGLIFGLKEKLVKDSTAIKPLDENDKPSLRLWHGNDTRLQSQQDVQAGMDRTFSHIAALWPEGSRIVVLTDSAARTGSFTERDKWFLATDVTAYQRQSSLDGINKRDVWVINPSTGEKRVVVKAVGGSSAISPDGNRMAYFNNGEWHVVDLSSLVHKALTDNGRFINTEDDHNIDKPGRPHFGWSTDSRSFLASDGWDIWRIDANDGRQVKLTSDGKEKGIRYGRPLNFNPRQRGVDLSSTLFFTAREERTKREAMLQLDPKSGRTISAIWKDARISPVKARNADVWVTSISTFARFPDFWRIAWSGDSLRLTDAAPGMNGIAWSPGARLVTYVTDKGDTLQGALFLPAGYQEGSKYPTVTYIYEKMSDNLHSFTNPTFSSSYTPSIYTSRGYAVFMPDIVYKLNDPGMSSLWAVVPAVKAAIATGIVDPDRVGIHGHSWGGYQTAFLVGQTNIFKAAVAGAPLTDMISMYSSVYWNTGSANQPIFQSSQGRFLGNFIENLDAYERNSPNRYAHKINTPLIILHNDKDGAVDYNQGITFFNTLRQMNKDVILLEYQGENHGLSQLKNRRDYTIRLMEFWDYHLKGQTAPEWLQNGVRRIGMDDHYRERLPLYKNNSEKSTPATAKP